MMSETWMTRFVDAFNLVLAKDPDTPPGPSAINKALGRKGVLNRINGRETALRTELLESSGFVKDNEANRWRRVG